ncbi:MAG TPA: DUF3375 domain-containing protein [Acidobacteriaceae bacterium]|jgi:hypothetical protein
MDFDYGYVSELFTRHPAWRFLRLDHAPLIVSFLHRTYIQPNRRVLAADEFVKLLDDELYALRQQRTDINLPKQAEEYLADWVGKDLLRKLWVHGSDEPHIDLTPATEKAIQWVISLRERSFIGTESRLLMFVQLLKQIAEESDPNVDRRLMVLHKQRAELDEKIARVSQGEVEVLSDSELRDRFQQITQLAYGLLADFREVEHNFRQLSRSARERIAMWDGSKGSLLGELWQSRDEIRDSDQGRSFEAFCDFLLSVSGREELSSLLSTALNLPAIRDQAKGGQLGRVHYDWIAAGEATQRTMATLSQQLRRFLDDQALLENRRIMEILRQIESHALALRNDPPKGTVASIDAMGCDVELVMDRPLFRSPIRLTISEVQPEPGQADEEMDALYSQVVVDRTGLAQHIATTMAERGAVTLRELTEIQPLRHGLAELVTYLDLGTSRFEIELLEFLKDNITWKKTEGGLELERRATMDRILFKEKSGE